jgi:hypothetical protein
MAAAMQFSLNEPRTPESALVTWYTDKQGGEEIRGKL